MIWLDPSYGMSFCELIHQPVNPALTGSATARAEKGDAADKILNLHTIIQRNLEQENHSFSHIELVNAFFLDKHRRLC